MKEITFQVVLKPKGGRRKVIQGKTALAIIEALKILKERKILKNKLPKDFSLAESVAMAIACFCKTPKEIADYIERNIKRYYA